MPKRTVLLLAALALGACAPEPDATISPAPPPTTAAAPAPTSTTLAPEAPGTPVVAPPEPETTEPPAPANSVANGPLVAQEWAEPEVVEESEGEQDWTDPGDSRADAGSLDWEALRQCENEGGYTSDAGDPYRGAYQFDPGTWASVGGEGDPADAAPEEQDARAQALYDREGAAPWPTCGSLL